MFKMLSKICNLMLIGFTVSLLALVVIVTAIFVAAIFASLILMLIL